MWNIHLTVSPVYASVFKISTVSSSMAVDWLKILFTILLCWLPYSFVSSVVAKDLHFIILPLCLSFCQADFFHIFHICHLYRLTLNSIIINSLCELIFNYKEVMSLDNSLELFNPRRRDFNRPTYIHTYNTYIHSYLLKVKNNTQWQNER